MDCSASETDICALREAQTAYVDVCMYKYTPLPGKAQCMQMYVKARYTPLPKIKLCVEKML